jgi:hypothetical protein
MTPRVLQQAALVLTVAREVGKGPVVQMEAVAIALKNRVNAGWYEDVLDAIEDMDRHSAHEANPARLSGADRDLQRFSHDIEDVWFQGSERMGETSPGDKSGFAEVKFWCWINRPIRDSFRDKIIRDPKNHPNKGQVGPIMFFE